MVAPYTNTETGVTMLNVEPSPKVSVFTDKVYVPADIVPDSASLIKLLPAVKLTAVTVGAPTPLIT